MLGVFGQDLSRSVRTLARQRRFSVIVILTLALGIGVNAAIFSVTEAVLLRPASFANMDSLVMILEWAPQRSDYWNSVAPANFIDWKENIRSVEDLSAYGLQDATLTSNGDPERIQAFRVSSNFFHTLGTVPMLGRTFTVEEEEPGHDRQVILSYGLWERRFGASADILQHSIQLNGKSFTVVGIMKKDFNFPPSVDIWVPLAMTPGEKNDRLHHSLVVLGRLKPGRSLGQVRAEMNNITHQLEEAYPATNRHWGTRVMPIRDFMNGSLTRQFLFLTMGAALFVLFIACINVGNLQLVRSTARSREVAVKLALGAQNRRIVRDLLVDSLVLAICGGVLSLGFAQLAIKLMIAYARPDMAMLIAGWNGIRLDQTTFGFAFLLAVCASLISGLAPALQSLHINLHDTLKEGAGVSGGRKRHIVRNVFVVAQVALSFLLLFGAALMGRGFQTLSHLNDRFDPHTLVTMRIDLSAGRYRNTAQRLSFYDQIMQRVQSLPGVTSAALASSIPFGSRQDSEYFSIEGQAEPEAGHYPLALVQSVSSQYLKSAHVSLIQGRDFTENDRTDSEQVVLISRNLARRFWQEQNPIGHRIKLRAKTDSQWRTIVGIVDDVQYDWTDPGPETAIYVPYTQFALSSSFLILRSSNDPTTVYAAARNKIAEVDPQQPAFQMKSLEQVIADAVAAVIYVAGFVAALGLIAIVLASVGVYGIMGQIVNERMHELRLRLALGAQQGDIVRLILFYGSYLIVAGLTLGLAASFALGRLLSSLLAGTGSSVAATAFEIAGLLAVVSLATCFLPAHGSRSIDPRAILRHE